VDGVKYKMKSLTRLTIDLGRPIKAAAYSEIIIYGIPDLKSSIFRIRPHPPTGHMHIQCLCRFTYSLRLNFN
jgi:hypothetical protein